MGLFKRKKRLNEQQDALFDKMADLFFGGKDQMWKQVLEAYELLGHRYTKDQISNALTWMTMHFQSVDDKSAQEMVDDGQMRRHDNPFSREDAMKLYKFVVRKSFEKNMPNAPEEMFDALYENLGNFKEGATTDVIPGAYGEYGLCVTNPIPTRGVPANEVYLKKLSLLSGEPFHWERIGSFEAPNIKKTLMDMR